MTLSSCSQAEHASHTGGKSGQPWCLILPIQSSLNSPRREARALPSSPLKPSDLALQPHHCSAQLSITPWNTCSGTHDILLGKEQKSGSTPFYTVGCSGSHGRRLWTLSLSLKLCDWLGLFGSAWAGFGFLFQQLLGDDDCAFTAHCSRQDRAEKLTLLSPRSPTLGTSAPCGSFINGR